MYKMTAVVLRQFQLQEGVSKTGNPWKKAQLLVERDPQSQFPKKILLTNMKDAEEFAKIPVGALYDFEFDIESREYQDKYFSDIKCFRFTPAQPIQLQAPVQQPQAYSQQPPQSHPQYSQPAPPQPIRQGNPFAQPQQAAQDGDDIPF